VESEKMFICGTDMIYLASCALRLATPDVKRVAAMDLPSVFKLSSLHSMQAVTFYALEKALIQPENNIKIDGELLRSWKEAKNKAVRKIILFDSEREHIFAFMNEHRIWHMPLKGVVLQKYYPKLGMRQITDNDILFDSDQRRELSEYMVSRGYSYQAGGRTTHDVYQKAPVLNFEMHVSLYSPIVDEIWYEYYKDIDKKLVCEADSYGRSFKSNDLYIYILTHMLKHHKNGGNGIRSLMDVYVMNAGLRDELDRSYISEELKKLNADSYEIAVRSLSEKIFDCDFDPDKLSREEHELLLFYISSGTFGTLQNAISKSLRKINKTDEKPGLITKLRYLLSMLFPPLEYYREMHPFLYKYRIFIPFFVIFRTVRAPFRNRRMIKNTLKALFKKK